MGRGEVPPVGVGGRRVVVTGASRGIGRALSEELARRGADLALVARPSADLDEAVQVTGGTAYACDLGDPKAVAGLVDRIEADGPVDVVVNNAGVSNIGWAPDVEHSAIDQVVQVNLLAPMHLVRDWLPRMVERGRGHVVNVSSLAAVMSPPGLAYYAASKAGVSAWTAGLRQDLRDLPVHLTTVTIGSVPTELDDLSRAYGPFAEAAKRSKGRDITPMEVVVDAIVDAIRTGRREVRLPRMMAGMAALTDVPRGLTRAMFRSFDTVPKEHA